MAAAPATEEEAEVLDGAIDKTLQKRIYQWRMPREKAPEDKQRGPICSFFAWLGEMLSDFISAIGELLDKLLEWLRSLFPEPEPRAAPESRSWVKPESLMAFILVVLVGVALYLIGRLWIKKRSKTQVQKLDPIEMKTPDLEDEDVRADELPADRWLSLAREMIVKGDLRLAMRAFYLATLAKLADLEVVRIEFYKSNLDYKRELDRRVREKGELRSAFVRSIQLFERVWYGMKAVDRTQVEEFAALQEKIIRYAQT